MNKNQGVLMAILFLVSVTGLVVSVEGTGIFSFLDRWRLSKKSGRKYSKRPTI
jgi:hypothetical protein